MANVAPTPKKEPKKTCNILFIIGNGFDLGLGMKTRYSDMYESYFNSESDSEVIRDFKWKLYRDQKYEKWSDFEMGMAKNADYFQTESEFIECVRDFKKHMVAYLESESEKMLQIMNSNSKEKMYSVIWSSLGGFENGFIPNHRRIIKNIKEGKNVSLAFLNFNYTKIFDILLRIARVNEEPIHIHGTLGEDIVTGVDGADQLSETNYKITRKTERAFIKPKFNEAYDTDRLETAKEMIMNSDIICSYGFSFGESDRTWLELISQWLSVDEDHHLVAFLYDNASYDKSNSDIVMEVEEEKKLVFLNKLNLSADSVLFDQIHIPVGYDIFNFDFAQVEANLITV